MNDTTIAAQPPSRPVREAPPPLSAFQHVREERLRITDLDFHEHVNNAAFTALLAAARYDYLGEVLRPRLPAGDKLVIGKLEVTFLNEMLYGSPVFTGTRVLSMGRTSLRMEQAMYQGDVCAAWAFSVWVRISGETGKPEPWPEGVSSLLIS